LPRRVRREIPKDLETITIKAMAKEPRGRYATAHAFAEDLRRYLADQPIEARRPGPLVRAAAALRRGRGRAALPAGIALAIAAALFVLLGGLPPSRPGPDIAEGMTLRTYAPPAVDALEESGVAPHATVEDWLGFLLPDEGIGTVVAAQMPGAGIARDSLCAFDMERNLLWSARGSWPDFDETLGSADASIDSMRCIVTRTTTPDPEETLLVSTHYHGRAHLLFLDPVTGKRRGAWAMPGAFGAAPIGLGVLGMIPESRTAPRRLIVGCTRRNPDGSGRPCAVLLDPDGTFAACYELPALGFEAVADLGLVAAKCDWSRDRPEIELVTTEGIFCAFLVREGRLDVTSVRVVLNDTIGEYYDAEFGEGSFDALVEEKGGYFGLLDHLAAEIREEAG